MCRPPAWPLWALGLRTDVTVPTLWILLLLQVIESLVPNSGVVCLLSASTHWGRRTHLLASRENLNPFPALGIQHVTTTSSYRSLLIAPTNMQKIPTSDSYCHPECPWVSLSHFFPLAKPSCTSLLFTHVRCLHSTPCLQPLVGGSGSKVYEALCDKPFQLLRPRL